MLAAAAAWVNPGTGNAADVDMIPFVTHGTWSVGFRTRSAQCPAECAELVGETRVVEEIEGRQTLSHKIEIRCYEK